MLVWLGFFEALFIYLTGLGVATLDPVTAKRDFTLMISGLAMFSFAFPGAFAVAESWSAASSDSACLLRTRRPRREYFATQPLI